MQARRYNYAETNLWVLKIPEEILFTLQEAINVIAK